MLFDRACCSSSGRIMLAHPHPGPSSVPLEGVPDRDVPRRECPVTVGVLGEGQPDLLEVVLAGGPPRLLAGGLDRRQEQGDQRPDDRDDHQELDQGEADGPCRLPVAARENRRASSYHQSPEGMVKTGQAPRYPHWSHSCSLTLEDDGRGGIGVRDDLRFATAYLRRCMESRQTAAFDPWSVSTKRTNVSGPPLPRKVAQRSGIETPRRAWSGALGRPGPKFCSGTALLIRLTPLSFQ